MCLCECGGGGSVPPGRGAGEEAAGLSPRPATGCLGWGGKKKHRRVPLQSCYEEKNKRPPPSLAAARPAPRPHGAPRRLPARRWRGTGAPSPARRPHLCSAATARPLLPRPEAGGTEGNWAKAPLSSGHTRLRLTLLQRLRWRRPRTARGGADPSCAAPAAVTARLRPLPPPAPMTD